MKGNCIYSASPAYETLPTNRSAYDRDTLQFRHGDVPPRVVLAALLFNEPCRSIIHNFFIPVSTEFDSILHLVLDYGR